MAPKALIPFLVAMMLLTGVCNTLLTKYQDMQCVGNCKSSDPKKRKTFEQPVIQTLQMFIGEMACWLVLALRELYVRYVSKSYNDGSSDDGSERPLLRDDDSTLGHGESNSAGNSSIHGTSKNKEQLTGWKVVYMALPACCDIAGTTLMNVGLLFVAASIYQMTRGALVLFVGIFSVIFLKRHLALYKWFALFVVVAGVALVGLAGAIAKDHKAAPGAHSAMINLLQAHAEDVRATERSVAVWAIIGVVLIACAQIFTAAQFVIEERIMEKYALEPLHAVSWEGTWGFLVTVIIMVFAHLVYGKGYFDAREGLYEVFHHRNIAVSSVLIMISIGGFNFFGLSVTNTLSATSRSTIDTCRTLFIWLVSLGLGWETFKWLQVAGFALLVYGTFLFNDLVGPPLAKCVPSEHEELLPEAPIEHNENRPNI